MTDPTSYHRRRERSPRSSRWSPDRRDHSRYRESRDRRAESPPARRPNDRDDRPYERKPNPASARTEVQGPPGFPDGYSWDKGDWLCPRPGCEGYVTRAKFDRCVSCGRSQPFFKILMELARNPKFRTELCSRDPCPGLDCAMAHSECERRDFAKSRELMKVSDSQTPPSVVPVTEDERRAFIARWALREPAVSVIARLPDSLAEIVQSTFFADGSDADTSMQFLKCLADLIRPRRREGKRPDQVLGYLADILRRSHTPTGVACSDSGTLIVTLDKDVLVITLPEFSDENVLGLLAFALSFNGMSVVHSATDFNNLKIFYPKLFVDLCVSRIRLVDNPSELLYIAPDETEAGIDRAVQARVDALNPNPLLPTP